MSEASKCDLCGAFFERAHRTVTLDVHVATKKDPDTSITWSEVDFCPACSGKILKVVGPALNDLKEVDQ